MQLRERENKQIGAQSRGPEVRRFQKPCTWKLFLSSCGHLCVRFDYRVLAGNPCDVMHAIYWKQGTQKWGAPLELVLVSVTLLFQTRTDRVIYDVRKLIVHNSGDCEVHYSGLYLMDWFQVEGQRKEGEKQTHTHTHNRREKGVRFFCFHFMCMYAFMPHVCPVTVEGRRVIRSLHWSYRWCVNSHNSHWVLAVELCSARTARALND